MRLRHILFAILLYSSNFVHSQIREDLRNCSYKAKEYAFNMGINVEIDSTFWDMWIGSILKNETNNNELFRLFISNLKTEIETKQFDFKKTIDALDQIDRVYLNPEINQYTDELIALIKYKLLHDKYILNNKIVKIFEISGYLKLPNEIKDSIVNLSNVPLKVLARFGNKFAEDSLINIFNDEYHDTMNYDIPESYVIGDLFYTGSTKTYSAISKALVSKHLVFILSEEAKNNNCKRWTIRSINEYILQEYFNFYNFSIERYIKAISFNPVSEFGYKKFQSTGDKTIYENYNKLGVIIYSKVLSEYISKKFGYNFNISYPGNYFELENRLEPPINMLDNYEGMNCIIKQYLGSDISKEYPSEYENMRINITNSILIFYKSLAE